MEIQAQCRTRCLVVALLALYGALAFAYSFADRLKYGPDEPAHFIYVRSTATRLSPPPIAHHETHTEHSTSSHEGHQPPLYYALMAVPFALLKLLGTSSELIWRVLRLAGIPIGMVWIWLVWVLTRQFFGRKGPALAATTFVALLPTSAFMAGVVNNEVLTALLFTWCLIPILAFFREGLMSARSALLLGTLMGLAALSKAQGLILVPVFLVAAFAVWRRAGYGGGRAIAETAGIVLGTAFVVSGWWFIRCWAAYGTPMPHSLHDPPFRDPLVALFAIPGTFFRVIWYTVSHAWGYFFAPYWVLEPYVEWSVYFWPLAAVSGAAIAGLVLRLRRNGDVDRRSLGLLLFAPALLLPLYLRYMLVVDRGVIDQGRLFLSTAAVAGIVFALGFEGLLRGKRAKSIAAGAVLAAMLAFNVLVIACAVALYG